jgi:hypothetical protein
LVFAPPHIREATEVAILTFLYQQGLARYVDLALALPPEAVHACNGVLAHLAYRCRRPSVVFTAGVKQCNVSPPSKVVQRQWLL